MRLRSRASRAPTSLAATRVTDPLPRPVMKIGGELGYRLLCWLKPGKPSESGTAPQSSYVPGIKQAIGDSGWESLRDKSIIDFGCGVGVGAGCIELA